MWVAGLLLVLIPCGLIYGLATGPSEMWTFLLFFAIFAVAFTTVGICGPDWWATYQARPITARETRRRIRREIRKAEWEVDELAQRVIDGEFD
jgi:sulfite exporter TauE/SafE